MINVLIVEKDMTLYKKLVNGILLENNNIRNATDWMYFDNEEEKVLKYVKNYVNLKPKPKNVIAAVLDRIRIQQNILK